VSKKLLKLFWFFLFATSVNDISGAPWAANISDKFSKKFDGPIGILRNLGENDSWKNLKSTISFLDVAIKGKVSSKHSCLIAQINQAETKLETTSGNDIKGTVLHDFLDVSIRGRVHSRQPLLLLR
jgi:hypothetical protein